jgi:hypothetical protein
MTPTSNRRTRKWLVLGAAGFASGLITLLVFRSIPIASTTAGVAVVAIVAVKHLALALVVSSPIAAFFQSVKPTLRAHCPFASGREG